MENRNNNNERISISESTDDDSDNELAVDHRDGQGRMERAALCNLDDDSDNDVRVGSIMKMQKERMQHARHSSAAQGSPSTSRASAPPGVASSVYNATPGPSGSQTLPRGTGSYYSSSYLKSWSGRHTQNRRKILGSSLPTPVNWSDNLGIRRRTGPNLALLKALREANRQLMASEENREGQGTDDICSPRWFNVTNQPTLAINSLQSVIINPRTTNGGPPPHIYCNRTSATVAVINNEGEEGPSTAAAAAAAAPVEGTLTTDQIIVSQSAMVTSQTMETPGSNNSDNEMLEDDAPMLPLDTVQPGDGTMANEDDNNKNIKDKAAEMLSTPSKVVDNKELNQALLSLLECPVCLECMEPPMAQCRRGHLICHTCRDRMLRCPVCRASFTSVRNRAMEQVAEKLWYPCRHGCGLVIALRLRVDHESSCVQRRYACPFPACTVPAMAHDSLINHFLDQHPDTVAFGTKGTFCYNRTVSQHDWIMSAYNQIFHVQFYTSNRYMGVYGSVTYIGPKNDAARYSYEISIIGLERGRKLVYSRETHSDLDCRTEFYAHGDAFFVTFENALNFIKPAGATNNLAFRVEVLRNEVVAADTVEPLNTII